MTGMKLLENSGIQYIGDKKVLDLEEKTLIVVGIARGGTSLVAGAIDKLGVFTGEQSNEPVFEDVKLATAYENKDYKLAKQIISEYNIKHKIWSFKRPAAVDYLEKINQDCRNPIYMFIFKDIFSIANRNNISMKSDILKGLNNAFTDYKKILTFIDKNSVNGFLLSYEKIMQNKTNFIDVLKSVVGENLVSEEQYKSALDFIEPNPKKYLDATRITKSTGVIDIVNTETISGWAKYVHNLNKSPEVELIVNGKVAMKVIADTFRADLKEKKLHNSGMCGFKIDIKELNISSGDIISVKVVDDVEFLKNSNWKIK